MTGEEKEALNFHGTNISYVGLGGLTKYVDDLLYREYKRGYDRGWNDSSKSEGSGSS